MNGLTSFISNL